MRSLLCAGWGRQNKGGGCRLFFRDLPSVHERRKRNGTHEVLNEKTRGLRPDYYLQNFHFQSGGWLTDEFAERYDTQVEVLFKGTANAMRRQALPPLAQLFAGRDQRNLRLVDIGCGTGRFLDFVKQAWPRLPVLGIDLSEAYITHARCHLRRWCKMDLMVAGGEGIPLPDNSCDAVTSIFLLHELPPEVRRAVIGEAARVLKPGGRMIMIDSLQFGDEPAYDGMLERFPQNYHEPYFKSYLRRILPRSRNSWPCTPGRHQGIRVKGNGLRQGHHLATVEEVSLGCLAKAARRRPQRKSKDSAWRSFFAAISKLLS